MTPSLKVFTGRAKTALSLIPESRLAYAGDEQSETECAAIAANVCAAGEGESDAQLANKFRELQPSIPELFQIRPAVTKPPAPWRDEITGLVALNPYAKETEDLKSQAILEEVDPQLAAHLKLISNGVTYEILHKLNLDRKQRLEVQELKYGAAEHAGNPWITGNEAKQMAIEKSNPNLAAFYRREATPITVNYYGPLQNLTRQAIIERTHPEHGEILSKAAAIHAGWVHEANLEIQSELLRINAQKKRLEAVGRRA